MLLICPGHELDDLEGITHTCDGVGFWDKCAAECARGVAETHTVCVCGMIAPPSKLTISYVLIRVQSCFRPTSKSEDCDGLASQEECTATCAESYEAK